MGDNFTNIPFTVNNLDRYHIRSSILNALKINIQLFMGNLLDVGCGQMPYREFILNNSSIEQYIGLDIEKALVYNDKVKPDFTWDGVKMPFDDFSYQTVMLTEVLEHVPEPTKLLIECYRLMKVGGVIFITVPFLWNLHEVPHDEYRFTPFALERILLQAGFQDINVNATGGWNASLGQMLGLWVRRSRMTKRKRAIMSIFLKPVMTWLYKTDIKPIEFKEGQMITGLWATAIKIK